MSSKYPFCCRKYKHSGTYEKYLRTAQANLDIVLASTVRYTSSVHTINHVEASILHPERGASSRIWTMNPIPISLDTSSMHLLLTSLILGYRMTLHLRYPADRSIIHPPVKQLETSRDLSKKTTISARTHEHRTVVPTVLNWCLVAFRVKYLNHKSMNTSQVASVIVSWPAIAL